MNLKDVRLDQRVRYSITCRVTAIDGGYVAIEPEWALLWVESDQIEDALSEGPSRKDYDQGCK
jgi:hypothetical protein